MRLKYARLKGYIGIYNGMDKLEEIEIDFSKAINKITIISGRNGSGKSTLQKALATPLPDNSSCFVSHMSAEKELHIVDNNNVYELLMISPITSNGTRGQSKAFIKKNGEELNSTGNITSYKDIIFTEFDLDPNFITLSRISGDDRGIADKSPADRKRFVSNIISSLEIYNSMNKILSKKANIFKSYINNLSIKIKNIGDEQVLYSTQKDIDNRHKILSDSKISLEKQKTEAESFITIVDPDGKLQDKYQVIYDNIKSINDEIKDAESKLEFYKNKLSISDDTINYESEKERNSKLLSTAEAKIIRYNIDIEKLLSDREKGYNDLQIIDEKISNKENDFDIDSLSNSIETLKKTISYQESIFKDSQISNFNISRDEFILIFTTLLDIKHSIDIFKSSFYKESTDKAIAIVRSGRTNVDEEINNISSTINDDKLYLKTLEMDLSNCINEINTMKVLEDRPKKCTIDTCPLIVNAINIKKQNPEKKKNNLEKDIYNLNNKIESNTKLLDNLLELNSVIKELYKIIDSIDAYKIILNKVPTSIIFTDTEELLTRISNGNTFNEISNLQKYIDLADDITDYRDNKELLVKLSGELELNKNKISIINDLKNQYNTIENNIETIKTSLESIKKNKSFEEDLIKTFNLNISLLDQIITIDNKLKELRSNKDILKQEYLTIKDNIGKIKEYIDKINIINSQLYQIEHDLAPLQEQKEKIRFSLATLESYKQELEMYKEKYNVTNILKKYSSPTAGGIQTLYMNIYMAKTLSMANEILGMLFNGEYKLLPYAINASEFRIPFIGNGLEVDDISSGSTSQVCMMGMVMNLVLLYQASTKFNIVFLDEQDGGLDSHNKYEFVNVLYKIIDILEIDQLIMISHSIEMEMSNVDVIRLKGYDEDEEINGNIIYQYGK